MANASSSYTAIWNYSLTPFFKLSSWVKESNQSPMFSDQVLLDIPCVESNIFNIKFIY